MSITRVAKLAGVSSSTVSRVINNHPRVAPETADTVRKVMQKIGYTPSANRPGPKPANRARPMGDLHRFLVLGAAPRPGVSAPGFEQLMQGVASAASRHNAELTYAHLPENPEFLAQRLSQQRISGIFISGVYANDFKSKLALYPCVCLMGNRRRPDFGDQVMQDAYGVGELAAQYLLGRGHKNVAFLNLDAEHWAIHLYGHAFNSTAHAGGATISIVEQEKRPVADSPADFGAEAVTRMVNAFLALSPRPTGLFIAEDSQTALLQPALQRAGVEFGAGKVEVVSCNNERPYLTGLSPYPATIDIRISTIGERGLEQLIRRVEQNPSPASGQISDRTITLVQPRLVLPDGTMVLGSTSELDNHPAP